MMRCSAEAYSICPFASHCAPRAEATFMEGSECDAFNQRIDNAIWMWRGIFNEPEAITHWMPLPEPPVKDGAEIYVSFADDSDFTGGSKP